MAEAGPGSTVPRGLAGFHTRCGWKGFLMPAALPSLLLGKDSRFTRRNNIGRGYNIGFLWALISAAWVFFGIALFAAAKAVVRGT